MSRLTPKQGRFVDAYMLSSNGVTAYREAYDAGKMKDASVWREVRRLLKHPAVSAEIERRQAELAERNLVSVESLTRDLLEGFKTWKTEAPGAAVAAYKLVAQLHGLLTEKRELSTAGQLVMNIHTGAQPTGGTTAGNFPEAPRTYEPAASRPTGIIGSPPPAAATAGTQADREESDRLLTEALRESGHWNARALPPARGSDESFDDFDSLLQERAD